MSKYRITLDGKIYEMEIEQIDGSASATLPKKAETPVKAAPVQTAVPAKAPAAAASQPAAGNAVTSPMPGTIIRLNVAEGDTVQQGQAVLVLEAMKMENEIAAPRAGKIIALHVKQGDSVQGGASLFEIGE